MPTRRVDYEALIAVYDRISRSRSLTAEESASLDAIIVRRQVADRTARYRAKHKERVNERERNRRAKNPEAKREADRRHTEKNSAKLARKAKAWREANPDKVKAYLNRKRDQDCAAK